jgi:hypothetical protein
VNDCATQRNLDDRGREQARRIGQALKDRGVSFDRILTSQWCRCRETADLPGLGPVGNSGLSAPPISSDELEILPWKNPASFASPSPRKLAGFRGNVQNLEIF